MYFTMVKSKKFHRLLGPHLPRGRRIEKVMGTEGCKTGRATGCLSLASGRGHLAHVTRFKSVAAFSALKNMGTDNSPPLYSSRFCDCIYPIFRSQQGVFSPCPAI